MHVCVRERCQMENLPTCTRLLCQVETSHFSNVNFSKRQARKPFISDSARGSWNTSEDQSHIHTFLKQEHHVCVKLEVLRWTFFHYKLKKNPTFWLSPLSVHQVWWRPCAPGVSLYHAWMKEWGGRSFITLLPALHAGSSNFSLSFHSFLIAGAPESLLSFPLQLQPAPTALRIFRCPLKDWALRPCRSTSF